MASALTTLSREQISSLQQSQRQQLQQPIQNWNTQIQADKTELSAWGSISGSMNSLSNALDAISDASEFNNRSASSSDESVASVSVDKNATPASYSLSDVKLAETQSLYSSTFDNESVSLGSASETLTITGGSGEPATVTVSAQDMTPAGIAQAINDTADAGVTASLVGGSEGQRLVITGTETGASNAFEVDGTGALDQFDFSAGAANPTMTEARAARDATLNVNGVPVSNSDNTLANAIPNGSITLDGSGSTDVSVSVDASNLAGAVSSVVSKLNSAVATIDKTTRHEGSGSSAVNGPLLGEFSARSIRNSLSSQLSGLTDGTLAARDIGIEISDQGQVNFDAETFKSAFAENPESVNELVSGIHDSLKNVTTSAIGETGNAGTIGSETSAIDNDIDSLKEQITRQSELIDSKMQIYSRQFSTLLGKQSEFSVTNDYLSLLNGNSND